MKPNTNSIITFVFGRENDEKCPGFFQVDADNIRNLWIGNDWDLHINFHNQEKVFSNNLLVSYSHVKKFEKIEVVDELLAELLKLRLDGKRNHLSLNDFFSNLKPKGKKAIDSHGLEKFQHSVEEISM